MNSQCVLCQLKSISRHLKTVSLEESSRLDIIQKFLSYLGDVNRSVTNPEMAAELNRLIAVHHPDKELYRKEKLEFNQFMLDRFDHYMGIAKTSEKSLKTAAKLAIAGNIIDFGPDHEFSVEETIERVLNSELVIDDSDKLFEDLSSAKKVLYLGDNAGEIVMDKLFVKMLEHPGLSFVTRGYPVLNDVIREDASFVGMDKLCNVLDNGTDIPSTVLNRCSEEFMKAYKEADVVISKGQGNLEGLLSERNKNIYFLFTVKCQAIAELTGTKKDDFVLMHSSNLPEKIDL